MSIELIKIESEEQKLRNLIPLNDLSLMVYLAVNKHYFAFDGMGGIRIPYETLKRTAKILSSYTTTEIDSLEKHKFVTVSAKEFRQALDANSQAATLTDATVEQLKTYQRYELLIQGFETDIYYGISPDGELAGIVNNGPWKNTALRFVVPDAIRHGAKKLNAWNVGGQLQKMYKAFGFKETHNIPYNTKTYGPPSEELKAAWRVYGWADGQPFPVVTYMELFSG
jgi:hypothetical protein